MGTILLGASNYTMQCLSSPTRAEVDAAHSKGKYLDIGLPSLRNLRGWKRIVPYTFLVLSTLPLHFLWNSAVFTTTNNLDYNVFVVTPSFFNQSTVDCSQNVTTFLNGDTNLATYYQQSPLSYSNIYSNSDVNWWQKDVCNISQALLANATQRILARLSNEDCINAYGPGNADMNDWGNVLAVTKEAPTGSNNTILLQFRYETYVSNYTGKNWVCDPDVLIANEYKCDYREVAANASSWTLGPIEQQESNPYVLFPSAEWEIDYCLAQKTNIAGKCQLQYSFVIMVFVLVANAVKLSCIIYFLLTNLQPVLATVGDGIASFLERPDPFTADTPFLDRGQARQFRSGRKSGPVRWQKPKMRLRWWNAPSFLRWFITLIL